MQREVLEKKRAKGEWLAGDTLAAQARKKDQMKGRRAPEWSANTRKSETGARSLERTRGSRRSASKC